MTIFNTNFPRRIAFIQFLRPCCIRVLSLDDSVQIGGVTFLVIFIIIALCHLLFLLIRITLLGCQEMGIQIKQNTFLILEFSKV